MLMPMAVGCGVADKLLHLESPALALLSWAAGAAGLACSVLHLGQPLRAWRIFLGLRRSWLSREAVVFGAWFALATLYTTARVDWIPMPAGATRSVLATTTAACGVVGLFCSVMIYVDTRRRFWRMANTAPRFFGTAIILGLSSALCAGVAPAQLGFALLAATVIKLLLEAQALAPLHVDRDALTPERKSALLLFGPLRSANELRVLLAFLGGILLPLASALGAAPASAAWLALGFNLMGELTERYLYFRAVDAPKMPGVAAA